MTSSSLSRWILAARLRTLPLACSSVLLGSGLAAHDGYFRLPLFLLCLLTAILLQLLSNLANDYGDAVSGADNAERVGPTRAVASGLITRRQMLVAMALTALAAVTSGLALLWSSFATDWPALLTFIGFGALALLAAITYTVGRRPYGYRGLGDLSVFLFFGLLGVMVSFVLGVIIGGIAGYYGGKVDLFVQRLIEIVQSLPHIPLWLALSAIMPASWSPLLVYFGITLILGLAWLTPAAENPETGQ